MNPLITPESTAFIRGLPKTETHLHLEGALPYRMLQGIRPDLYPSLPPSWSDSYRFESFRAFEDALISMAGHWFTSPERYHDAASAVFESLRDTQNVRYVECSFASGVVEWGRLDGRAVCDAIRSAVPSDMEVRIFMGIHHTGYHDGTASWIDAAVEWPSLDGLDLHGDETAPLGPWAAALWSRARAAGKTTKAHAGEFAGPAFVRRAIHELGVRRVEHGVRAVEDGDLVRELVDSGVTLDVCPISNVKLGVVAGAGEHPIRRLINAGVPCTLSTDDPLVFGNTLYDEYALLAGSLSFSRAELAAVARTGFEIALVDDAFRNRAIRDIEQLLASEVR